MTFDPAGRPRALLSRSSRRGRFLWPALLFLAFVLVGLGLHRDYGVSWDEPTNRKNGMITLAYVGERFPDLVAQPEDSAPLPELAEYRDRTYGVAFEAPLALLERLRGLETTREIYQFRHLVTFLVCSLGLVAVLRLADRRYADWRLAVLAALIFILSPRQFADSFYNGKDAVFMAAFALATSTAVSFLLRPTLRSAGCHAAATAFAIDVRVVGILLPAATVAFFVARLARGELRRRAGFTLAAYLAATSVLVVAFWPYLWPAPWAHFLDALGNMARFPWGESVLYLGEVTPAAELPWHYIPVWIGISTPIPYLVLFVAGVAASVARIVRARRWLWKDEGELQDLFHLALVVGPLASVIALDSVLYDGWRQMYFLYPAMVLVALRGWVLLWNWRPRERASAWPRVVGAGTVLALLHTCWWMARAHPYQNLYLNVLAGRNAKARFDLDYWGLTNGEALQAIVDADERPLIRVLAGSWTQLGTSALMLRGSDRARLRVARDEAEADYIVTNYRFDQGAAENPAFELFRQIRVDDEVVHSTYVRRDPQGSGSR
jgi:hypothetical protein